MPLPGSPANALPADDAALMRRIEAIERQLRELGPSVASSFAPVITDLQAQQATLAAQQAATALVVAELADVVDAQVTGATGNASTGSAVAYGTSGSSFASFNFTVPSGFTEARILAVSGVTLAADSTCIAQTQVGGVNGSDMPIIVGGGAAALARTITGLTGGDTIAVATRMRSFVGTSSAYATTSASVMFLR